MAEPNMFPIMGMVCRYVLPPMSGIPQGIDVGEQPPMTIPLRHFLVGLGFLLVGGLAGLGTTVGPVAETVVIAHIHLLFAGWICVTIMGAMTQFVPVWSGVALHSQRLAALQLWFVGVGLLGFGGSLVLNRPFLLPLFGSGMLIGFWIFAYNVGRTLRAAGVDDVTERHFALALGFFVVLTVLGLLLAIDFVWPVIIRLPVSRSGLIGAHATVAVFGAVLTTVFGALYQLGPMFTQTDLHGIDVYIRRFEEFGYPLGVVALATGRLFVHRGIAMMGGLLVVAGTIGMSWILGRRLVETQVAWTPILSRYVVLAAAMASWAVLALPAWLRDPLAEPARVGAPGTVHLLALGVPGFVVLGTLYHIVPFIVWVHRYSDRLGYDAVPMVDDLYSDRIARIDFVCFVVGTGLLVLTDLGLVRSWVAAIGGMLLLLGSVLFIWNLMLVMRDHSPLSVRTVLLGGSGARAGN